jgi:hypothetical protein
MEQNITEDQLNACASYFLSGGLAEWVSGGLVLALFVYSSFSKKSLPQVLKVAPEFLLGKGKDLLAGFKKKK